MKNERNRLNITAGREGGRERRKERKKERKEETHEKRRIVRNTQVGDDYPSPEPILGSLLGLRRKKRARSFVFFSFFFRFF